MIYAVVFLVEVLLRLVASGIVQYFCAPGWGWNWLDVFVVTSTWIELLFSIFETWLKQLSAFLQRRELY